MTPTPSPLCPSCNRYIGPANRCPYCSANATPAPIMRTIRVTAIALATAGLFLLYAAARHREPPLINLAEITPAMNFAHVRVQGSVSKAAYISRDRAYVGFTIHDKEGNSLRIAAYRDVAKALLTNNMIPATGDQVEVRGSLSVTAKSGPKLYLKSPKHLTIQNPTPSPRAPL